MSTTAGAVAVELRKLADAFDQNPNAVVHKGWLAFYADTKEEFVNAALLLPRPLVKGQDSDREDKYTRIYVERETPALDVKVSVYKALTCVLVEPAKPAVYSCDPILSGLEIDEVTA